MKKYKFCKHAAGWLGFLFILAGCQFSDNNPQYKSWRVYKGDHESTSYSSLDQINKENVAALEEAWRFHTGDQTDMGRSLIECNPIIAGDVMYVTSQLLNVIAIEADTGEEIWRFDPYKNKEDKDYHVNRGVVYWENGDDRRILFTAGYELIALDAEDGSIIEDFGKEGRVDLRDGLLKDKEDVVVNVTSPGITYQDIIILGSQVKENYDAAPGYVRAYNIKTGERVWTFHTIPKPGEFGHDTWPEDAWKNAGGANVWAGMALDRETGTVFLPTGAATYDFYGKFRKGKNLFANSLIAVDATTGERKWHFQTIHHGLWDYDLPAPPNLVTVEHEGRQVKAVAQVSKNGFVYLFNRETGEPLFPIEEKPVPQSDVPGEETWPTQPFPTKPEPFARQHFPESLVSDLFEDSYQQLLEQYRSYRYDGMYTPPSEKGSLILPGTRGGAEWGGAAFDPASGMLYINANESAEIMTLKEVSGREDNGRLRGERSYTLNCATCHGTDLEGQHGIPSLVNVEERLSKRQITNMIKNGGGRMPAFSNLNEGKISAIVDYITNSESKETAENNGEGENNMAAEDSSRYINVTAYSTFSGPEGYQAIKPPWGTLNAINLNTGEIAWKVPLGFYPELKEKGFPNTGTQNIGGPIVTAGGLVIIGATKDEMIRAFDKDTGEILWEQKLPTGGFATPSTYQVNGKQFIVIAAGGGRGTPSSDIYVAYALPEAG